MNVKDIRRENLRSLAKSIGGITAIAKRLGKSQSQISHLIGTRPIKNIGDRLSAEIEKNFEKSHGWLDKEHFRVNSETGVYVIANDAPRILSWVPILKWEDLQENNVTQDTISNAEEFVPVHFEVSPRSFALRVCDDSMDAPIGVSFPRGTTIIVDPSHIPTHSSFIVLFPNESDRPVTFKQLIHEGHQRYLKPLNPRYEQEDFPASGKIMGVVRQLMMKVE